MPFVKAGEYVKPGFHTGPTNSRAAGEQRAGQAEARPV